MAHKQGDYGGLERDSDAERERLTLLAQGLDPQTRRWMQLLGIAPGWRCLEIGAATGSMSRWMAEQVGPTGRVVACDLDTRFLDAVADLPNLEVRRLDIRSDALERDSFDLAYCRTLLLHLPDHEAALRRMIDSLRPGGLLLVQEPDMCLFEPLDSERADARTFREFHLRLYGHLHEIERMDTRFGRTLAPTLRRLGLADVEAEATAAVVRGDSPTASALRITLEQVFAPPLLAQGVLSQKDCDAVLSCYRDPDFEYLSGVQFVVWGRKPATAS